MLAKIISVRSGAWWLLAATLVVSVGTVVLRLTGVVSPQDFLHFVQPLAGLLLAGLVYLVAGNQPERARNKKNKAVTIGSVLAIWFVLYFMSGLVVTYVNNALVSSIQAIAMNLVSFSIVAITFEYARHHTLLMSGRRNLVWFGAVVSVVFALQQVNLSGFSSAQNLDELVKFLTSDVAPALANSLPLTYLAVSAGLLGQLVFRLGLVAITVLPPVIPKYDWYMIGVTAIILAAAVYIIIDHESYDQDVRVKRHQQRPGLAFDVMFGVVTTGLVMFMLGVFSYKPIAIMSNSMAPLFNRGSMVVVQKINDPMDISVGDIIQYEADNKMITHRVVEVHNNKEGDGSLVFITKGDNSPSADAPVEAERAVGVIRASIPYIGYPTVWLKEASKEGYR